MRSNAIAGTGRPEWILGAALAVATLALGGCASSAPETSPGTATPTTAATASSNPEPAANELFLPVPDAPSPSGPTYAKRARAIELNTDLLATNGKPIDLTLTPFPDLSFQASVRFKDEAGIEQWTGKLAGSPLSTVLIVRVGDTYNVHVSSPEGVLEASTTGTGFVVSELDPEAFPSEGHLEAP